MADLTSNTVQAPTPAKKRPAPKTVQKPQVVQKETSSYDTGNEVTSGEYAIATKANVEKDTLFYSNIKSLRLKVLVPFDDDSYEENTVVFNNERFVTSNKQIVELLRSHPNYGGSHLKRFEDRIYGSREPLFWEGGYPEDVRKMREQQNNALVQEPGIYEKGADS